MDSNMFTFLLPILLAIMMIGLGLELKGKDFIRVIEHPKVVFLALFTQLIILPLMAFLICLTLELSPVLSVGMMLLAASPGGTTANLLSYIYKGDIALNISLTAINSVIAIFTLPFLVNISLIFFLNSTEIISNFPISKILFVFLVTIAPVSLGILICSWFPNFARICSHPMRMISIIFLGSLFCATLFQEIHNVIGYLAEIGIATALFCFCSLFIGYLLPHLLNVPERQARACTFEVGIHNTGLAMTIGVVVLGHSSFAVPAAIYTIFMYIFATVFGFFITNRAQEMILGQKITRNS
jgi:bile acid:Na+ symporter, BASS family